MFHTFHINLTWRDLVVRTAKEANQDNALGLAAQLSYYFLLALVPAVVCVVALASFLPPDTIQNAVESLRRFAPGDVVDIVRNQLTELASRGHQGVFTFGLLLALWSSSAAMVAVVEAMNKAYDIDEARPWWKVRLTAIALTLGVALFIVLAFGLVLVGPMLADQLAGRFGLGAVFATAWKVLQWPVVFALVALGLGIIYYFAPDAEQDWEWITPGAVLGTLLWVVASLGFKVYVVRFGTYNETYGSLGGIIVLMFWFYLSALAILIGAEMNAEIEHASPHGKAPGEKVPGQRKMIGARAARAFAERMRGRSRTAPEAPRPSAPPAPASHPAPLTGGSRAAAYALMAIGLLRFVTRRDR
jgi:membrane protein